MATERSSHLEADRHVDMDYVASEADSVLPTRTNASSQQPLITVYVLPTTGGEIKLQVSPLSKVSALKNVISNKIRLSRDKIVLLQKNRQLTEGTLEDNLVGDGARLILVPCVEAGLLTLRPEHSVLKALNTLTDAQVDNVLMGRVPLNLSMRLGGHMMFIQLQLTTTNQRKEPTSNQKQTPSTAAASQSSAKPPPTLPQKLNIQMPSFMPTPPLTPTTPNKTASFTLPSQSPPANAPAIPGSLPTPPSSPETRDGGPPSYVPTPVNESELQSTTMGLGRLQLQHVSQNQFAPQNFSSITSGRVATPKLKEATTAGNQQYNKLAEASRNLTQTLKQLSSVALDGTSKPPEKCQVCHCSKQKNGAVIESLYHHGKGIYSGTFVGSLSPSLQDRDGRPRQNISTIIHILNDLLGASLNSNPTCKPGCCAKGNHNISVSSEITNNTSSGQHQNFTTSTDQTSLVNENELIRGKIEQIQSMMEERKQRRKARREVRGSPYGGKPNANKQDKEISTPITTVETKQNECSISLSSKDETSMEV